jgi:hypothetical protein
MRKPSIKLRDDVYEAVRAAKGDEAILDVVLAAVGVQAMNVRENVALEDIVTLLIEEATRNQVAVEISTTELLLPTTAQAVAAA